MLECKASHAKIHRELQSIARQIRREIVVMIGAAKSGHPGGSLSAVEILVELYFNHMHIDPKNPALLDRDRFILSKGHAAPVLYAVMAEAGYRADSGGQVEHPAANWVRCTRATRTCATFPRSKLPPARWAKGFRWRSEWGSRRGWTAANRAPTRCWATAKSRKDRSGRRPWPAPSTSSTTWWPSWTTTASSSMAS
jgi:hypothetical protein